MARWALLSALESALELRLTVPEAVVRLRVALAPSRASQCAHGMYRNQLHLRDGVPDLPGPWQHDRTEPGHVLMHGLVGELVARLCVVLSSRPNAPGTQFYWRATCSTSLAPSPAFASTASLLAPIGAAAPPDGAAVSRTPPHAAPCDALDRSVLVPLPSVDPPAPVASSRSSTVEDPAGFFTPPPRERSGTAWDDEGALLHAIVAESCEPPSACRAPPTDDDPTDVRPSPLPLSPSRPRFRLDTLPTSHPSTPTVDPAPSTSTRTQALVAPLLPSAPALPPRGESLLVWNAAGWWCGDSESGSDEHQAIVASRYDVLDPLLRGRDAPTYIVLNEVSGSMRDSAHPRGLGAWLRAAGYGHFFYPGGSTTRQRSDGSTGATGGVLLAWLRSETSACGPPHFDPKSMTIALDFRHRSCARDAPPMRLLAVYGAHRRNGREQALRAITRHVTQTRGCLAAGDLNVVPSSTWKCRARRMTVADEEFAALTDGGALLDAGASTVHIVDLGLDHDRGQFSRAHWTATLADGSPQGTATLDHVLTAGLERGRWQRRAAWFAFGDDGKLLSDHMVIVVDRAPRSVITDDLGVHRPPRFMVSRWSERQCVAFIASFARNLHQLRAGVWRARPVPARGRLDNLSPRVLRLSLNWFLF